jgi:recombination protein RecR
MGALPDAITNLIAALGKLPGIGPRSAERLALYLVQSETSGVRDLANMLVQAREKVKLCSTCGALTEQDPCAVCSDSRRDSSIVCIVERPTDILSIEKMAGFRGKYHVLGGKISPLNGVEPEDLRIAELETRMGREPIKELILALSTDVEGEATSFYLAKRWRDRGIRVSRIAYGLPAGSGLEFADEITLSRALEGRRPIDQL